METTPIITDAVRDSASGTFFQASGPHGTLWFSASEYLEKVASVHAKISRCTGRMLATARSKSRFAEEIENFSVRDGDVIAQAGWNDGKYACGDGTVLPVGAAVDIVTFAPLAKFTPLGDLKNWLREVGPIVQCQTLPYFAVSVALTGPLIRFLPAGTFNPMIELVGERASGKSTLAVLASSVWSGDPAKTEGGGESWSMTPNAFDMRRQDHRDGLLVFDEAEGSAPGNRDQIGLLKQVIFTGAATSRKARMTDVDRSPPPLRAALLSTSNTSVAALLHREPKERREAAQSRLLTILIDRQGKSGLTVLDTLPAQYASMEDAVSALRVATARTYGSAGPAFAESHRKGGVSR